MSCLKDLWRCKLAQQRDEDSSSDELEGKESKDDEEEIQVSKRHFGRGTGSWSSKEDAELAERVCLHGEGNWAAMLESSRILRKKTSSVDRASDCIRRR